MKNSREAIRSRQNEIVNLLKSYDRLTVSEIASFFKVSEPTIRRDLDYLDKHDMLRRSFGYATAVENDVPGNESSLIGGPAKINFGLLTNRYVSSTSLALAQATEQLIDDGDTVFINSSSSALNLYRFLGKKHVLVVTNNLLVINEQLCANTSLLLVGGSITKVEHDTKLSLLGDVAIDTISRITATKCILGVSGISAEGGVTCTTMADIQLNRAMMSQSTGKKIILAAPYKIGRRFNYFNFDADKITDLVTGASADPKEISALQELGVHVTLVEGI